MISCAMWSPWHDLAGDQQTAAAQHLRDLAWLRRGDLSVTEVCFAVGCSSLGTFSTRFTELAGMPPSTYRRQTTRATAGMPPCDDDPDASLAFYRDALGFEVRNDVASGKMRWITVGPADLPGT